jgi:thiol-disulfide isomerase/thioredoxin
MYPARLAMLTLLMAPAILAQTTGAQSPDGLTILKQMSQHYTGDGPWYIEAIEEQTSETEYSRQWTKTVMIGAVSDNEYHFEGHSQLGSALHISDGKTAWDLHPEEHAYTQELAPAKGYVQAGAWDMNEQSAQLAVGLRKDFANFTLHHESATRRPDEVIFAGGIEIPCYVVEVHTNRGDYSADELLWIAKADWNVRKKVTHQNSVMYSGNAHIPMVSTIVTNYERTELNSPVPAALFHFDPPADAKLLSKFSTGGFGPDLTGESAPEVQLIDAGGKPVPISQYRGKPILLDFWATWCAPCVASLPELAQLEREAAPKGLMMLSVDEDENAKTATDFLAKNRYAWPNTHDDGKIGVAFSKAGIPLVVLIDPQGKIAFYKAGEDDAALRKALAGLGPEYASLAAPQKPPPCETASK